MGGLLTVAAVDMFRSLWKMRQTIRLFCGISGNSPLYIPLQEDIECADHALKEVSTRGPVRSTCVEKKCQTQLSDSDSAKCSDLSTDVESNCSLRRDNKSPLLAKHI